MKPQYDLLHGIPIWKHLKNNGSKNTVRMISHDYGHLAERIGKRVLAIAIREKTLLPSIFPDVTILSTHKVDSIGDYTIEVDYKVNDIYGKKAVVFEIKHGHISIGQNQLRKYSNMIQNPSSYFPKADEVKVIYMLFDRIDTASEFATYTMCELNKNLAAKITARPSVTQPTDVDSSIEGFFTNIS